MKNDHEVQYKIPRVKNRPPTIILFSFNNESESEISVKSKITYIFLFTFVIFKVFNYYYSTIIIV